MTPLRTAGVLAASCLGLLGSARVAIAQARSLEEQHVLEAGTFSAPPEHRLEIPGRRWALGDYLATAAVGAAYAYVDLETELQSQPRWKGGLLFDEAARQALVGRSVGQRNFAGRFSDQLGYLPVGMMLFDSVFVPLLTDHGNFEVAVHATLLAAQSQTLIGLFSGAGRKWFARERPDVRECRERRDYDELCFGGPTASFPSGHTTVAFGAAGLLCAHHLAMPLYGGGWPDIAACAAHATIATGVGVLRLTADRHYATDVLAGAVLGAGAGFLIPWFGYYQASNNEEAAVNATQWTLAPVLSDSNLGLGVHGSF